MVKLKINSKYSKRLRLLIAATDLEKYFDIPTALAQVKSNANAKFSESVDLALNLGVDPKHSDQMVRGVIAMPHGTGKTVKVAVFARDAKKQEALDSGADIVGAEDLKSFISRSKRHGELHMVEELE